MAQIIGHLRKNATFGEKVVFKALRDNLPNEFTVYVETPIYRHRKVSNPDFIVLTNYGFIILEVKDWYNFINIDRIGATINTDDGPKYYRNPVGQARDYALDLVNVIGIVSSRMNLNKPPKVPYGFGVILPNLMGYHRKSVREAWGDSFIMDKDNLVEHLLKQSLRNTIRGDKITPISKKVMDIVRGAINPEITFTDGVVLDEEQASIVLEPTTKDLPKPPTPTKKISPKPVSLFTEFDNPIFDEVMPAQSEKIINTNSIRLVRGVMGSGKTLVLLAKAKRWARLHPEWNILVLAFNKELATSLKNELKNFRNIHTTNLHQYIVSTISRENKFLTKTKTETESWIQNQKDKYPIISTLGVDFVTKELGWIQEVMIKSKEEYLNAKRIGRGNQPNISKEQRSVIFDLLQDHLQKTKEKRQVSWEQLVIEFLHFIENEEITVPQYDAILIDEAQDFAPSWIAVVNKLLKPDGSIFMVDDPTQSIFRYFSWKRKGIEVTGRSVKLKTPYRNTLEIYSAASSIVKDDPLLINQLKAEGEEFILEEELSTMRRGDKPIIVTTEKAGQVVEFIESRIQYYKQKKRIAYEKMCVILPNHKELSKLQKPLGKYGIKLITANRVKGLTFEVVFVCSLENYFRDGNLDDMLYISNQKRLVYTSMGRARRNLYLLHQNKLSSYLEPLKDYVEYYRM